MAEPLLPLPDDIRAEVRAARHPNRDSETEAVHRVDAAVAERVHVMDGLLADQGEVLLTDVAESLTDSSSAVDDAAAFAEQLRDGSAGVSQESARQYERLRSRIATNLANLEVLKKRIQDRAARCDDPEAALQYALSRFPALRSGRAWIPPYESPVPRPDQLGRPYSRRRSR